MLRTAHHDRAALQVRTVQLYKDDIFHVDYNIHLCILVWMKGTLPNLLVKTSTKILCAMYHRIIQGQQHNSKTVKTIHENEENLLTIGFTLIFLRLNRFRNKS